MLYFFSLRGFDPRRGLISEPHGKYPFLLSRAGVFEPDERNPKKLIGSLERAVDANGLVYYISEPNVQKLLHEQYNGAGNIIVDHARKIDNALLNQTLNLFYEGYRAAENRLYIELGESYLTLSLAKREQQLLDFIEYTHDMLYFEGFAIPDLLYALGYMQASLIYALKEYQILEQLIMAPNESDGMATIQNEQLQPPVMEKRNELVENKFEKLLLLCPQEDVLQLWQVLADEQLCEALNVPVIFPDEDKVKYLLGSLFDIPDKAPRIFPSTVHHYRQLSPGYMNLLCLLMHATYKLNHSYTRTPLKQYCALLKSTFSSFESIEAVQDIVSNISKKADAVLPTLIQTPNDKTKEALAILKKIGIYRLTL